MSSASPDTSRLGLSFSLKLSFIYALFFVLGALGLLAGTYLIVDGWVAAKEREVLSARIQEYRAWYAEGGLAALKARFEQASAGSRDISFLRVVGPRGGVLWVSLPPGEKGPDPALWSRLDPSREDFWLSLQGHDRKSVWTVASVHLGPKLVLQVGKNSTESHRVLQRLRSVFLWISLPVLLVGLAGGTLLAYRGLRPLRDLIHTVRQILETGRTDRRVPPRGGRGELAELVHLFNRMLERNDALLKGMRESLDNVAHDLRTPMTRLRGMAELALQRGEDPELCREALADCLEESERILSMLNALMDVAEAETGVMHLELEEVSLPQVLRSVAELYGMVAEDKGVELVVEVPDELTLVADRARLQQVVANLVDNALKYIGQGRRVELSARQEGGQVVITVRDDGQGIPSRELPRIFDRLYRGDRSRAQRGLGLGLSLVRAIVQAHGGRVEVQSTPGRGSTFRVFLPLRPAPAAGD